MIWHNIPHKTHKMGKEYCEILAPCGTPRFYSVRNCKRCGAGQAEHAAGHFCDPELLKPCIAVEKNINKEKKNGLLCKSKGRK